MHRRMFLRSAGMVSAASLLRLGHASSAAAATHAAGPADRVLTGEESFPEGFVVPAGQVWALDPQATSTVRSGGNIVVEGTLRLRPARPDVVHTLQFVGVDERAFVGGGHMVLPTDVGLWVTGSGVLDAVGAAKTPWTRAQGDLAAGTDVLQVQAASGWAPGDEVAVTATGPGDVAPELRTVAAVDGTTVRLDAPLHNAHPAVGQRWTAEVLNLTRNVRIEGTPEGRAHVMFLRSGPQQVAYIAIRHMGPRQAANRGTLGVLGRYGFHFHEADTGTAGTVAEGVVVRDTGNHAFVTHMSHGITLRETIAYATMEDAYWWDEGDRTDDTTWERCVAADISADQIGASKLCGFFLGRGVGNAFIDCVASGVAGFKRAAGFQWPLNTGDPAVWLSQGGRTHNNVRNGVLTWKNTGEVHVVDGVVAYHNGSNSVEHGSYRNGFVYRDGDFFGNGVQVQATSRLSQQTWERIRIQAPDIAVKFVRHKPKTPFQTPILFQACELIAPQPVVVDSEGDGETIGTQADFVDCGLSPADVTFVNPEAPGVRDSVIRIQTGGQAWRVTPAGVTEIAPFAQAGTAAPPPGNEPAPAGHGAGGPGHETAAAGHQHAAGKRLHRGH